MKRTLLAIAGCLALCAGTTSTALGSAAAPGASQWTVYDYNPSNQALAPRNSPNSMPATTIGDTTSFPFILGTYTALLTTSDRGLTGNLAGVTLHDTVAVSGTSSGFTSQNGDGCNAPASVRFYFASPAASGSSVGTPPAGFYTSFWWSNPVNVPLISGQQPSATIMALMGDPNGWSDWNGQPASNPAVAEAFRDAVQNVQTIGLSFGGGCFFENGVTITDGSEMFSSTFSETP